MAQASRFWNGTVLGDAVVAPYDADREFADVVHSLALQAASANRIILTNELNVLAVTGASSPLSVDTGVAFVDGTWYVNDAAVAVTVPTPGAATRYDWIVLEKDWATQTVRIARVAGVEGAGVPPALTQTLGTKWQAPIYYYSVTTGGVITLVDQRLVRGGTYLGVKSYENARCRLTNTATQTVPSSWAALTWDTEVVDVGGLYTGAAPSRITIPESGAYEILSSLQLRIAADTIANFDDVNVEFAIRKNGAATNLDYKQVLWVAFSAGISNALGVVLVLPFYDAIAGDFFEIFTQVTNTSLTGLSSIAVRAEGSSFNAGRMY